MVGLSQLDISIFILYFIALLSIGFFTGKSQTRSAGDFFLAKGKLRWYVIGFSIITAGISSEQFLGTVGFAYSKGLSVANWEWLNGPSILILVFLFIPFYIRKKVTTMPHFLGIRYNGRVRLLFAIITILTYSTINLAGVIYSGGYAMNVIFGFDLGLSIWVMALVAGVITIWGGMSTVAWTNVLQAVLLLGSGLLVFFLGLNEVPGGFDAVVGSGSRAHLVLPANDPDIPWTGLVVLALSTNVWYYCTNQTINQATLGAKNEWHAKMGIIFAGFLWAAIAFADVFPGLIAYALNPNIEPDAAYPFVVKRLVPAGLKGIVIAGLTGAILSTVEAIINAISTIFTFDIYKQHINTEANDKKMINVGRTVGGLVLIFGALWAPMVQRFGHIFSYFQECYAFIAIPIVVVFVGGLLSKKAHSQAAFYTLLLSFPMFLMPYLLRVFQVQQNVFNVAGYVLLAFIAIFIALNTVLPGDQRARSISFVWNGSMLKLPEAQAIFNRVWYRNIGFWSGVMVILYVFIYAWFW